MVDPALQQKGVFFERVSEKGIRVNIQRLARALIVLWIYSTSLSAQVFESLQLSASDGATSDFFGNAVAISGEVVLVGAYWDSTVAGFGAGSAYAYRFDGSNWVEESHLHASDAASNDLFGSSVSIDGDLAIVGAWADDTADGIGAGSAYLFRFNGTDWVEEAHLTASDGSAFDRFGYSVCVSGTSAIVGAPHDDTSAGNNAGSAYVFRYDGQNWVEEQHLFLPLGFPLDQFGWSVDLSGDRAMIGIPYDDASGPIDSGSVQLYQFDGTSWCEEQRLYCTTAEINDNFGYSVSVDQEAAIVGVRSDQVASGTGSGAAIVYRLEGVSWTEEQRLYASDAASNDQFGASVSLNNDVAIVGARYDDIMGWNDAGSAYIYRFNGSSWSEEDHLIASSGVGDDRFGISVGLGSDMAIVGAYGHDMFGVTDSGSAYLFEMTSPGQFIRGDCDRSGGTDLADAIVILSAAAGALSDPLECLDSCDASDDGVIQLSDGIYLLSYLFAGGSPPTSPFPDCGIDQTADALDCFEATGSC